MRNKTSKKKKIAIGVICLAAAVTAATLTGMASPGGGPPDGMEDTSQNTVVETTVPFIGDIAVTGSYVGTVEPGQQVTVFPKVSGEVQQANYQVGDTVEAGAVLFRIDSTSQELSIAQQQASLASSQAQASYSLQVAEQNRENYETRLESGINNTLISAESALTTARNNLEAAQQAVDSAKISVQSANSGLSSARRDYRDAYDGKYDDEYSDSQLNTMRDTVVTKEYALESAQQALEQAEATLEQRKTQLEQAEQSYNSSLRAVEEEAQSVQNSITQAQINADTSSQQLQIQQLQNTLKDYTVTAPISGVIEQRSIDPYDIVSTQTAAYIISNKELFTVTFNATESAVAALRYGDTVTVEKDGEACYGTISEISNMVDASSGLYTIKAVIENPPMELRSGSTVKVYADTQKSEGQLLIPIDSVYYDNGNAYVYTFVNNTAVHVDIETGIADEEYIVVKSGLSLTDEVISTWSGSLYDGAEVYLPGTAPQDNDAPDDNGDPDSDSATEWTPEQVAGDEDAEEQITFAPEDIPAQDQQHPEADPAPSGEEPTQDGTEEVAA